MKILLIVYDNGSFVSWFPQGIAYIASALRKHNHEAAIYNQDVYHWPEEHLQRYLSKERFDIVGFGACGGYYQFQKSLKISKAINEIEHKPYYIMGGHLVSPCPEYFLKKMNANAIVIGEGEATIVELVDAFENKRSLSSINGIAYRDENGKYYQNKRRDLIEDIDKIPFPAYDLFPIDHYALLRMPHINKTERCMPMLSGRGCNFKCNFCYRMDKGFRPRSSESIIEEIKLLQKEYYISYIAFGDELLMSSTKRTVELCEAFIRADLNIKWDCNGRLNYAKPEVLKLMKRAGCVFINYGIESMDDEVLRNMNKALTTKQIIEGIENTIESGISPGYNVIFGNIGENRETLRKGVEFLLKYDDHSQFRTIRPVTPYPGSPLFYYAIEKGLLKDCAEFYEFKHTNSDLMSVNFTDLKEEEFYEALYEANELLITNYYDYQKATAIESAKELYMKRNPNFRGFRQL